MLALERSQKGRRLLGRLLGFWRYEKEEEVAGRVA